MDRVYNAIVLVDHPGDFSKHYATMVCNREKTIETRMKNIIPMGDIVICCGKKSMTRNKGLALCLVYVNDGRLMVKEDEEKAKIEMIAGRWAFELSDWRYFNRKFEFTKHYVSGSYQSIFQVRIPKDVEVITP